MQKVWNITDDPRTDVPPRMLMVFGQSVSPGRCIKVPNERLKNAHKLRKDIEAGLVHVGPKPPEGYLKAKAPVKLSFTGHKRAHSHAVPEAAGKTPEKKPVPKKPAPKKSNDTSKVEEIVEKALVEEEKTNDETTTRRGGRSKRG